MSYIVSRQANLYFFIDNLSERHRSARLSYNAYWKEFLGPFSSDEQRAIRQFRSIRIKYPESHSFFEAAFFGSLSPWKSLRTHLSEKEFVLIRRIFSVLTPRFNKLYNKERIVLTAWKEKLERSEKTLKTKALIKILRFLYGIRSISKNQIRVFILVSAPKYAGGGANVDNDTIALEISGVDPMSSMRVFAILWHELIHLRFETSFFMKMIEDIAGQRSGELHECIARLLLPNGVLGERYFERKLNTREFESFTNSPERILQYVRVALREKHPLDKNIVNKIFREIKKRPHSRKGV